LNLRSDWQISGSTNASLRFYFSDQPQSQNPGALTFPEYDANPDSAAANNIRRDADASVDQEQLSLTLRHVSAGSADAARPCSVVRTGGQPRRTGIELDRGLAASG
jgi:hypothetical protein